MAERSCGASADSVFDKNYLSYDEFMALDLGYDVPETDFRQIAPVADIMVNHLCGVGDNFPCPSDKFLRAVAFQIAYIYANGGVEAIWQRDVVSEKIGDYSYETLSSRNWRYGNGGDSGGKAMALHPAVIPLLLHEGLLNRRCHVGAR